MGPVWPFAWGLRGRMVAVVRLEILLSGTVRLLFQLEMKSIVGFVQRDFMVASGLISPVLKIFPVPVHCVEAQSKVSPSRGDQLGGRTPQALGSRRLSLVVVVFDVVAAVDFLEHFLATRTWGARSLARAAFALTGLWCNATDPT